MTVWSITEPVTVHGTETNREKAFSRAIRNEAPKVTSRADFRHAKQLFQDGRIEEALRMYTLVRDSLDRSDSYWAICHNQMGLCYSKLGNDELAIASYTTAIETGVHKDLHIWHMNRAVKLKVSGLYDRAKADFDRVVLLRPDSPQAQKAREHLLRLQPSNMYSTLVDTAATRASSVCKPDSANVRNHVIDLWNRLAKAYAELGPAAKEEPTPETPPDSVCCALLMLGDKELLQWFLMGSTAQLGPNPWKPHGCLDDVDVFCRLSKHSIPIISGWLGDICDGRNGASKQFGPRATAVRKWLSNSSVLQSAPVSLLQLESRLMDATLDHCAAVSGDIQLVSPFAAFRILQCLFGRMFEFELACFSRYNGSRRLSCTFGSDGSMNSPREQRVSPRMF